MSAPIAVELAAATVADLDAIDAIERASLPEPWPRETFAAELTRPWARVDVARVGGAVVGFCDYWIVAASHELHVLVIATHPDARGRGVARALLDRSLAAARAAGCTLATLEVRRSNRAAIALYERAGFRTVHVRARYYQRDGEDALVMVRELELSAG